MDASSKPTWNPAGFADIVEDWTEGKAADSEVEDYVAAAFTAFHGPGLVPCSGCNDPHCCCGKAG